MTTTVGYAVCKCGHPYDWHPAERDEQCTDSFFDCMEYIPKSLRLDDPRPAWIGPSALDDADSIPLDEAPSVVQPDDLIAKGKQSHAKRTANLALKAEALLAELAERLDAESATAKVRAEIAKAEAKLAELRAQLSGATPVIAPLAKRKVGPVHGEYPCDACDHVSTTSQGRAAHRRFNHKDGDS